MRKLLLLLPWCVAAASAGCSFLLDFDGLQEETGKPDAGTGSGGSGGSGGGSSGAAGKAGQCGDCEDNDPCTLDSCEASGCTHTFSPGLGLELEEVVPSDYFLRTTMIAGVDAFYFSVFEVPDATIEPTVTDLALYQLGIGDADTPQEILRFSEFTFDRGQPLSAAGLAIDTNLVTRLHSFTVMKQGEDPARVVHVSVTPDNQRVVENVGMNLAHAEPSSPYEYPAARTIGGKVHTAFTAVDRTIAVASVEPVGFNVATFGDAALPASTVALLGATDNTPVVLFASNGNGVYLEDALQNRTQLDECQTLPGVYQSASVAPAGTGLWFAYWTKYIDDGLTTENRVVACAPCQVFLQCADNDANNFVRNAATALEHLPGDPANVVHIVSALPRLYPDPNGGEIPLASVLLTLAKTDFEDNSALSGSIGESLTLGEMPAATDLRGPDYPSIAIVPGNPHHKVALTWVQPAAEAGTGDELHIQRYRMCLPPE